MNWKKLSDSDNENLFRGTILRFPAKSPYEKIVDFMIVDARDGTGKLALLVNTGRKAGILVQRLPNDAIFSPNISAVSSKWLKENWKIWVYPDCEVDEVIYSTDHSAQIT